jgi:hypothetical protein
LPCCLMRTGTTIRHRHVTLALGAPMRVSLVAAKAKGRGKQQASHAAFSQPGNAHRDIARRAPSQSRHPARPASEGHELRLAMDRWRGGQAHHLHWTQWQR